MYNPNLQIIKDPNNYEDSNARAYPLIRLFPNIITIIALCAGMTSIRYALDYKWEKAAMLIIIAAFIDGMDGRIARMLKVTSNFGAQLDSISDFVNFGVAPAIIIYLWNLHAIPIKGLGWAVSLLFSICCALRLARFNTALDDKDLPNWSERFFVGVPSTLGGCLAIIPMMLSFQFENLSFNSSVIGVYTAIIGILMVSRIPTFSAKKLVIRREFVSLILAFTGILMGAIIVEPWLTIPFLGFLYVLSIPFSIISFNKRR